MRCKLHEILHRVTGRLGAVTNSMSNAVSSIYIWSENSRPKSGAKDGGNFRPVPVTFYCFYLRGQTRSRKECTSI